LPIEKQEWLVLPRVINNGNEQRGIK